MANETRIGGKSREEVALELLRIIAYVEGKSIGIGGGTGRTDRKWVLSTYNECLDAASGNFRE